MPIFDENSPPLGFETEFRKLSSMKAYEDGEPAFPFLIVDRSEGLIKNHELYTFEFETGKRIHIFRYPFFPEQPMEGWGFIHYDNEYLSLAYSIHQAMLESEDIAAGCTPLQHLRGSKTNGRTFTL